MRFNTLLILAAVIIGLGCVTIPLPAPKETAGPNVFLPAAQQGDVTAQLQVAQAYRYGTAGLPQSNTEAMLWLEKAAHNGNVQAQLLLADVLMNGEIAQPKQPDEALKWLQRAADSGASDAQFYLADMLEAARGVPANAGAAAMWYEKAARQGHRFAAWRLARLYEQGRGVAKQPMLAYAWYRVADAALDAERLRKGMGAAEQKNANTRAAALQLEIKP